ncbi:hypothetical protein C8Q76DRAFT_607149 [Earliella scabrosa]|nr:hypothetical protein C8Q76DRAFT_605055 [Earliella scabrosa]KAI0745201.1 hypothetical protein C8Q76DRAFT_606913 [Earliella scabrosa]KAI0745204.1 hypothetical protein C8Q76DRAFT_607149 [Earliella scabrosa]
MDIETAIRWRAVCRALYEEVTSALYRERLAILEKFVSSPTVFLHLLTKFRAVIGGIAAVAFVLRDPSIQSDILQIYVGNTAFQGFVDAVQAAEHQAGVRLSLQPTGIPPQFSRERHITCVATFRLRNKRSIIVYRSSIMTGSSIIARSVSSALMNYVTEHTFACGYPELTFSRRGIISNMRLHNCCDTDYLSMLTLVAAGFDLVVNPLQWPEYQPTYPHTPATEAFACLRARFLCPHQGHYFGDAGSLVGFFDPKSPAFNNLRALNVPPFGPTVAWRLLTTYDCIDGCEAEDPVLHEWLVTTPVLFLPNPFRIQGRRNPLQIPSSCLVTVGTKQYGPRRSKSSCR